jgi:hypothetical protein
MAHPRSTLHAVLQDHKLRILQLAKFLLYKEEPELGT